MTIIRRCTLHLITLSCLALSGFEFVLPTAAIAEWYVAGQVGPTFADSLKNIGGTGPLSSITPPDTNWDLKNSLAYGAKLGYFGGNGWFGLEGEIFNTTPHIKQIADVPGTHLRVTTVALNFIGRYPGVTFQPYAGIGFGLLFAHLSDSATKQSDSDTSSGLNLLAGLRFFVTPYVSMFTEYKFQQATFIFDKTFRPTGGFIGDYRAQHLMLGVGYHF
jgi:opacity protein-like surface antigen